MGLQPTIYQLYGPEELRYMPAHFIIEALPVQVLAKIWHCNKDTAAKMKREPWVNLQPFDDPRHQDFELDDRRVKQLRDWLDEQI